MTRVGQEQIQKFVRGGTITRETCGPRGGHLFWLVLTGVGGPGLRPLPGSATGRCLRLVSSGSRNVKAGRHIRPAQVSIGQLRSAVNLDCDNVSCEGKSTM